MPLSLTDWETILKIGAAGAAAVGAILKLLPGAAAATRKQRTDPASTAGLHVVGLKAIAPWRAPLDKALKGNGEGWKAERDRIRVRSMRWCGWGVGACAVFVAPYLITWSIVRTWLLGVFTALALVVAATVAVSLLKIRGKMKKNEAQFTGAEMQVGSVELIADRASVEQYALLSVETIGGRVLGVERCPTSDSMKIYGTVGTRILPILYLGEFITVSVDRSRFDPAAQRATISSTKLDFLTPSRSRKNIENYLGCWLHFQPAPTKEQGGLTSGRVASRALAILSGFLR